MKRYISPEMEVIKYEVSDTLLTSVEDNGIAKDVNDIDEEEIVGDQN